MGELKISVLFSCQNCPSIYRAVQRRGKHSGQFMCLTCGATVHAWTGHFNFSEWKVIGESVDYGSKPLPIVLRCKSTARDIKGRFTRRLM